ncbi:hypothetical protein [Streptomyces sp. NPDC050738]|uniref:hypothetical protein n=1 Tax=Streptomyces sp. NPDC050738 TaxID=3154744 RepID=UPI00342500F1
MVGKKVKQRLEMEQKPARETETKKRSLDLSVPQVAGSAIAAVVAAVLASRLGVYGTIIGAGLVSVVATCGGTIFQHLFRRTGEQIREVTVQVKPRGRQVAVRRVPGDRDPGAVPPTVAAPWPEDLRTQVITQVSEQIPGGDPEATQMMLPDLDRTQLVPQVPVESGTDGPGAAEPGPEDEFTDATTHGTRMRGWKRSALAAVVVFVVAMGGITGFELLSGQDLSGGKGTTVGGAVTGGGSHQKSTPSSPTPSDSGTSTTPGGAGDGRSPSPDPGKSGGSTPDPSPSPSSSSGSSDDSSPTPTPTPAPSESTGTGGGDASSPSTTDGSAAE